ncbi:autotransporter outer membrane beta-barrel domain-containing protein [Enterobacter soli]|uniref:autotransporter outer membrane beta-barrel domain-containing protein n=1 Tax=Enterobacter soli TaxID=885040 RepID=UPI003D31338D
MKIQPFVELNWWYKGRAAEAIINGTTTEIGAMNNITKFKCGIGVSVTAKTDISLAANFQNGQSSHVNTSAALKAKIRF